MSGGTPTSGGGGIMRQRHSQGYWSGGEDLEDDASSRTPNPVMPSALTEQSWTRVLENFIWLVSASFIVCYGDRRSNMLSLLWSDGRIRRMPLHAGTVTTTVNVGLALYTLYSSADSPKSYERFEALPSVPPLLISLGFLSFCLFAYALWPIWSFLTIPLLITLLMASMVISPYLLIGPLRPKPVVLRDIPSGTLGCTNTDTDMDTEPPEECLVAKVIKSGHRYVSGTSSAPECPFFLGGTYDRIYKDLDS